MEVRGRTIPLNVEAHWNFPNWQDCLASKAGAALARVRKKVMARVVNCILKLMFYIRCVLKRLCWKM